MAIAKFYQTTSKRNEVNKNLTMETQYTVRITSQAEDIIKPTLEMESAHSWFNYVLLNGRYYYIVKRETLLNNRQKLYLDEDVLSTWYHRCDISGVIESSSKGYNMDMKQNFPKQVNKGIKRIVFKDIENMLGQTFIAQSSFNCAVRPDTPTQGGE